MALLPEANKIQDALTQGEIFNPIRPYLGMSMIGHQCNRYLQYYLKRSYTGTISKRIERLFRFGHEQEPTMINSLKEIGAIVEGAQIELVGFSGHWRGHIDGLVSNLPGCEKTQHLLEMKTHNDKSFKDVVKSGVRVSKPAHYAQMQRYMGGLKLKRGLYMAMNKNDSAYYTERVRFDEEYYAELLEKEQKIIFADELFPRIGNGKSTWFECKFCDARGVCHDGVKVVEDCTNCTHVLMKDNWEWECSKGHEIEVCEEYQLEEMLRSK